TLPVSHRSRRTEVRASRSRFQVPRCSYAGASLRHRWQTNSAASSALLPTPWQTDSTYTLSPRRSTYVTPPPSVENTSPGFNCEAGTDSIIGEPPTRGPRQVGVYVNTC